MNEFELYKLFKVVLEFRKAIEKCDKFLLPASFKNFPFGSSNDADIILAHHLKEKGYGEFYLVEGVRLNHPHTWLIQDNIVVDITPDKFEDQENKVIVSANSKWHEEFNGKVKHKASIDNYDNESQTTLLNAYKIIVD